MKRAGTLRPFVAVLERDLDSAKMITGRLRKKLSKDTKVEHFSTEQDAWAQIDRSDVDPYLVVTDHVGVFPPRHSFAKGIRTKFPRTRIILFSDTTRLSDVVDLQNRSGLIDKYLPKKDGIDRLAKLADECCRDYEEDQILSDMRQYIRQKSTDAKNPIILIGAKKYSLYELYWEMSRKTKLGTLAVRAWGALLMSQLAGGSEVGS